MKFLAEMTDTFGGEANYSWVENASFELPDGATDLKVVRRAKELLGLTGVKCDREEYGETIVLRPRNTCTIVFIDDVIE